MLTGCLAGRRRDGALYIFFPAERRCVHRVRGLPCFEERWEINPGRLGRHIRISAVRKQTTVCLTFSGGDLFVEVASNRKSFFFCADLLNQSKTYSKPTQNSKNFNWFLNWSNVSLSISLKMTVIVIIMYCYYLLLSDPPAQMSITFELLSQFCETYLNKSCLCDSGCMCQWFLQWAEVEVEPHCSHPKNSLQHNFFVLSNQPHVDFSTQLKLSGSACLLKSGNEDDRLWYPCKLASHCAFSWLLARWMSRISELKSERLSDHGKFAATAFFTIEICCWKSQILYSRKSGVT